MDNQGRPTTKRITPIRDTRESVVVWLSSAAKDFQSTMRIELFFKGDADLKALLQNYAARNAGFAKASKAAAKVPLAIHGVNLPCKGDLTKENLRHYANLIAGESIPLCLHYSLNYEWYAGSGGSSSKGSCGASETPLQASMNKLVSALWQCHESEGMVPELLIVSGSKKRIKQQFDVCAALDALAAMPEGALPPLRGVDVAKKCHTGIGVAYNPYFGTGSDAKGAKGTSVDAKKTAVAVPAAQVEERQRLKRKLETGLVSSVWLQFGTDLQRLKSELAWLTSETEPLGVQVFGSFFVPTKQWLARFRFRPWNGVFCTDEFLQDGPEQPETAREIVSNMLQIYHENGVEALCESACKTDKDFSELARTIDTSRAASDGDDMSALLDTELLVRNSYSSNTAKGGASKRVASSKAAEAPSSAAAAGADDTEPMKAKRRKKWTKAKTDK